MSEERRRVGPPSGPGVLVDTHAHLQDERLRGDLPAILARAWAARVHQVIAIGITAEDSAEVVAIAADHPEVFAAVGYQPNGLIDANEDDWARIVELAGAPKVVAIGETGLDRYWDRTPFPLQQEWFRRHLELARDRDLPVVIHCRACEADVVEALKDFAPVRGVLHSFNGTLEQAEAFLGLGLHISFAGMLTFRNRSTDALREVAPSIPIDRLLVETDSPYLSPEPRRGRTNEPAHVAWTARKLAELRGIPVADLARALTANARELFRLPVPSA